VAGIVDFDRASATTQISEQFPPCHALGLEHPRGQGEGQPYPPRLQITSQQFCRLSVIEPVSGADLFPEIHPLQLF